MVCPIMDATIKHITRREAVHRLVRLSGEFRAAAADVSRNSMPAPENVQTVLYPDDQQPGLAVLPPGASCYYPLRLTGVCRGNQLSACFDCLIPGPPQLVSIRLTPEKLAEEMMALQAKNTASALSFWNLIQLETARLLSDIAPPGKYGVPAHVVDAFFVSPQHFENELNLWLRHPCL